MREQASWAQTIATALTRSNDQDNPGKKAIRLWTQEEAPHVTPCDGGSIKNVRVWIAAIKAAKKRAPAASVEKHIISLILHTARGELYEEIDNCLNARGRDVCSSEEVLKHVLDSFLGPDEEETLRDELKRMKQAGREDIPAYNRRYKKAAAAAYPNPSQEEEKCLARFYIVSLLKGRIQDKLFDRNPRLETLTAATTAAHEEWSRVRFRERAMAYDSPSPSHEPMEVDELTTREKIAKQEREIKSLRQRLASATSYRRPHPATPPRAQPVPSVHHHPRPPKPQASVSDITCYSCNKTGHIRKNCPARRNGRKLGGNSRSTNKALN